MLTALDHSGFDLKPETGFGVGKFRALSKSKRL
jgi:hypothetical protein